MRCNDRQMLTAETAGDAENAAAFFRFPLRTRRPLRLHAGALFRSGRASCIVFLAFLNAVAAGCSAEIVHGLSEPQANQVVSALSESGIPASTSREEGGRSERWTVSVAADDRTRALAVMRENGLPRSSGRGLAEVFPKPSLIPTPTEERAMMMQAVMGELERTLETIDGVTLARVHVVLPGGAESGLAPHKAPAASAAVLIKTRPNAFVDRAAVKRLVAKGVESLKEENVTVEIFEGPARNGTGAQAIQKVGPVYVHGATAPILRTGVAAAGAIIGGLGIAVVLLARRARRSGSPATEAA